MRLKHAVRLVLRLIGLVVVLTLGAYGSVSTTKLAKVHVSHATNIRNGACGASFRSGACEAPLNTPPSVLPKRMADAAANPIRLIIPTIGVNAFVESLGIQSNGDLATPTHNPWEDVGWYNAGPHPGERGSAVIDGHLDRPGGYPAVFWYLNDLHAGDEVLVMNTAGKMMHFRVTRIAFYTPQEAPIQDIFGNEAGIYLNLITCAGDWIANEHQTTLRLVVYTVLA